MRRLRLESTWQIKESLKIYKDCVVHFLRTVTKEKGIGNWLLRPEYHARNSLEGESDDG